MEHVKKGRLNGPFLSDTGGRFVTVGGPKLVFPAVRFGPQQGQKLRAGEYLKRNQTNRAAAIKTPVNHPTREHFSAIIRTFQERGAGGNVATTKADHKDAY